MSSGIYEIVNTVNGHRYIGSAVNILGRWRNHKSELINNKHRSRHLQNAWNKYGADCFDFRVIEYCFFFMLIPREQHYIDTLKPEYNISPTAGNCLGVKRSDETKAKISATKTGKKQSPEHIAKLAAARIGKKRSPETRAKMSIASKGRKHTTESKIKMSVIMIGNKNPLGHKHTPEHNAKISAAKIIYWANRRLQKEGTHAHPV